MKLCIDITIRVLRHWQVVCMAAACLPLCSCQVLGPEPKAETQPKITVAALDDGLEQQRSATDPSLPNEAEPPVDESRTVLAQHVVTSDAAPVVNQPPSLPPQVYTGAPAGGSCCESAAVPCATAPCGQNWAPPGIVRPWPRDEFVCDGGDAQGQARISKNWKLYGVEQEDTIAHYDTIDGRTVIEPSNRVCIYAPRFAAVRRVYGMVQHEQHERSAGVEIPLSSVLSDTSELATTVVQPLEPRGQRSAKSSQSFRERMRTVGVDNRLLPGGMEAGLLPFEDFLIIRRGHFDNSEKARLAAQLEAAVIWTHEKAVQVVIDNMPAVEFSGETSSQSMFTYEMPPGKPRLRIVKIASQCDALPGEIIHFTLRFDNLGDQTIGNVTIVDNLSTRLEYMPESQECSLEAEFLTETNEGESLVLRWEITEPLDVGDGGVIRFQCRVR